MADTPAIARELGEAVDKLLVATDHVQRCAIAAINSLPSAPQEPDDVEVIILSSVCGKHFNEDCYSCRTAKESNDHRVRKVTQEPVADDDAELIELLREEAADQGECYREERPYSNCVGALTRAADRLEQLSRLQAKAPETGEE